MKFERNLVINEGPRQGGIHFDGHKKIIKVRQVIDKSNVYMKFESNQVTNEHPQLGRNRWQPFWWSFIGQTPN